MRLNEFLGIKYPIIQGGMANIALGEFAAAVSNAGGLGLIASGGFDAERIREEIKKCRALTDKPFGVNLMLMNPDADAIAKVWFGGQGIIGAILIGLAVGSIYTIFIQKHIVIKMPEQVPQAIAKQFEAMIPASLFSCCQCLTAG